MDSNQEKKRFDRGMYRGVKVSVKTLNIVIVVGIALICGLLLWGIATGGYHVTYNSRGGSDVAYQEYNYGDELHLPENPTRQGYEFEGWFLDENGEVPLELPYTVEGDLTLYAEWKAE